MRKSDRKRPVEFLRQAKSDQAGPLYKRIANQIRVRIEEAGLKPHHKLPSYRTLCEEFSVSEITVRRAVQELAKSGVIYLRNRSGTYVAESRDVTATLMLQRVAVIGMGNPEGSSGSSYSEFHKSLVTCAKKASVSVSTPTQADILRAGGMGTYLEANGIQGLILIGIYDHAYIYRMSCMVPTVLVDAWSPGVDSIQTDCLSGTYTLTQHLLELGHCDIAFLGRKRKDKLKGERLVDPDSYERLTGFRMAMEEGGVPVNEEGIILDTDDLPGVLERILALDPRPSALVTFSASQARPCVEQLEAMDVHVPQDMSVVTLTADPESLSGVYPFTCVYLDYAAMGTMALERLQKRFLERDAPAGRHGIEGVMVTGRSVKPSSSSSAQERMSAQ